MTIMRFCFGGSAGTGWNQIPTPGTAGVKFAAGTVVDSAGTVIPGVEVELSVPFDGGPSGDGEDIGDSYPSNVQLVNVYVETEAVATLVISGIGAAAVDVDIYANRGDTVAVGDRVSSVEVTGATGSTFTDTLDASTVDGTTEAGRTASGSVTLGASDDLVIEVSRPSGTAAHVNAIIVDFTAGSDTSLDGDAAAAATATGEIYTANLGIPITGIFKPNQSALVDDATGVSWAVFDHRPDGTETRLAAGDDGVITGGAMTIDNQAIGVLGGTAFVSLAWDVTVGEDTFEVTYSATETIIDLDA